MSEQNVIESSSHDAAEDFDGNNFGNSADFDSPESEGSGHGGQPAPGTGQSKSSRRRRRKRKNKIAGEISSVQGDAGG